VFSAKSYNRSACCGLAWFRGSRPPVISDGERIKSAQRAWGIAVLLLDMFSSFDFHLRLCGIMPHNENCLVFTHHARQKIFRFSM